MRWLRSCACLAIAVVSYAAPAVAQSPPREHLALSATIGASRPQDEAMSAVYGSPLMPIAAQAEVRVASGLWAFGGVKWVRSDGQTVVVGNPLAEERYPTTLGVTSYRLGALVSVPVRWRWSLAVGAGLCVANYEETWPEVALTVNDRAKGFVAIGEARYRATPRWSVVGRAEYTTLPATTTTGVDVNLGGVDVSAGLRFVF